jgi:hypothetical protein
MKAIIRAKKPMDARVQRMSGIVLGFVYFFRLGDSPKSGKMVVRPIWTEEIGKCKHILVVPEVERLFA